MTRTFIAVCLALTSVGAASCANNSRHAPVADVATRVTDPSFEGTWASNAGRSAVVKKASGDTYKVTITDKTGSSTYDVGLLDVGGKRFVAINVHQPDRKSVPVYMYGRLDIQGNNLTYARMRNDWLERAAKNMPGATYRSTGEVQPNTGGVVMKDVEQMHQLLEKAASDPAAFGEPEQAHRVK